MLANGTSAAWLTARTVSRLSAVNSDSRRSCRVKKIDCRYQNAVAARVEPAGGAAQRR